MYNKRRDDEDEDEDDEENSQGTSDGGWTKFGSNNVEDVEEGDEEDGEEDVDSDYSNRGKEFISNGFKWQEGDYNAATAGEGGNDNDNDNDSQEDYDYDKYRMDSDSEIEWQPMGDGEGGEGVTQQFLHTVNLTEAEAAFIARQKEGDAAVEKDLEDKMNKIHTDFSSTLPNWGVREEVEFWLHGRNKAAFGMEDDDDDDDDDDDEEEEKYEESQRETNSNPVMFWGHSKR